MTDRNVNPENVIRFYRASEEPYGAFSKVRAWLLAAPSPSLLAMAAHGLYSWDIAPGWSRSKYDRMRGVLRAKFTQHLDLQQLLLSTGDARLVEAGTVDNLVNRTWGEVNGRGKNMLGVMLMELRADLRSASAT